MALILKFSEWKLSIHSCVFKSVKFEWEKEQFEFLLCFLSSWSMYSILNQFTNAITFWGQAGQFCAIWPNNLETSEWQ